MPDDKVLPLVISDEQLKIWTTSQQLSQTEIVQIYATKHTDIHDIWSQF